MAPEAATNLMRERLLGLPHLGKQAVVMALDIGLCRLATWLHKFDTSRT
ncbi:MAG: hypothetical protein QE279_10070 [Rhodoferax sp.]|nr:hypothetical protein [Rhodoferax sp.]